MPSSNTGPEKAAGPDKSNAENERMKALVSEAQAHEFCCKTLWY